MQDNIIIKYVNRLIFNKLFVQAANKDLDVQVVFVEDLCDILNVPDENLFILEDGKTAPHRQGPRDSGAAEDITKIEQFLGQPIEVAVGEMSRPEEKGTTINLTADCSVDNLVEDQPSEDIDEIQRFLELSQADDRPDESRHIQSGSAAKGQLPPSVKFKIPKSPEFKKRFQDKEIVKIVKGTDSHKNYEKVRVKKLKPVPPSFEQQLHEAELIDLRTTMEKKRKWKNKSSTRDYMITKKYAKIVGVDKRTDSPEESRHAPEDGAKKR